MQLDICCECWKIRAPHTTERSRPWRSARPGDPGEEVAYCLAKHDVEGCIEIGPEAEPALIHRLRGGYDGTTIDALTRIGGLDALESDLEEHRALLARCRRNGIDEAFQDLVGG